MALPSMCRGRRSFVLAIGLLAAGCGTSVNAKIDAVAIKTPEPVDVAAAATPTLEPLPDTVAIEPVLVSGQCFTAEELQFVNGLPVACASPHVAEFFAVMARQEPSDAAWPGLETVQDEASDYCNARFGEVMGVAGQLAAIEILFFRPDDDSWDDGDREVACFVQYPDEVSQPLVEMDPMRAFGLVSTFALRAGECVADASLTENVAVSVVSCDAPHWFEVYHSVALDDQPFPDEEALNTIIDELCGSVFETFVGIPPNQSELEVQRLFPTRESWEEWDDRLISCAITTDQPRSESAEGLGI